MSRQDSSGDFFSGFLLGALVGAAVGLLFAPAPGEELREQLKEKSIEFKAQAEEFGVDTRALDEFKARGQALLEQQRLRFEEAVEEGRLAAARRKEELLAQLESAGTTHQPIDLADTEQVPPSKPVA